MAGPVQLVNVDSAVAEVAKLKVGDRPRLVNEYLRGVCDTSSSGGRALLHRRALFITSLREKRVWPQ